MSMYERIKEHCENNAMSLAELTRQSGVSHTTFLNMKNQRVSPATIRRVADVLELTKEEMRELVEINKSKPTQTEYLKTLEK